MGKEKNIISGQKFGRLTAKYRGEDYIRKNGDKAIRYYCDCDCGNTNILILKSSLTHGLTKSCGCYNVEKFIERVREITHKTNKYDLSGEYGIGWTSNTNEEFYFDLEDYDKIKDCCWRINSDGYIIGRFNNKDVMIHKVIMNLVSDNSKEIDHKDRNKLDNRKDNLRVASTRQNLLNKNLSSKNTSGITGVSFRKKQKTWIARISVNEKPIWLGSYIDKEDAIVARLKAEKKYYGEFAPQQHLYEQYGIV